MYRCSRLSFVATETAVLLYGKLLENITFVDTPGVLSGEKQRTQRAYDFTGVTSWFAAKCDLILLLFDPHKLDVSDEFKRVISSLRGHDDKIRVVLNKADQIDTQQVRVLLLPKYLTSIEIIKLAYLVIASYLLPMSPNYSWCGFMEH